MVVEQKHRGRYNACLLYTLRFFCTSSKRLKKFFTVRLKTLSSSAFNRRHMWVKLEFHFRLDIIGIFNLVSNLIHHHRQVLKKHLFASVYKFSNASLNFVKLKLLYSPRCIFHDASVPQPYLTNLIHIIPMNTHIVTIPRERFTCREHLHWNNWIESS